MIKKLFAALLALIAAAAFAAVDANKADQAALESIKGIGPSISTKIIEERKKSPFKDWSDMVGRVKGIGEGNAARFSSEGLTVNGVAFKSAPTKTDEKKPAKAADSAAPAPKAADAKASAAKTTDKK